MRFETTYTEKAEGYLGRSRAVRSIFSPALQQKSVERMANSPHNFVVFIRGGDNDDWPPVLADAVTLVVTPEDVADFESRFPEDRTQRESLYTAFTYLHRFGDVVTGTLLGLTADTKPPHAPLMDRSRRLPVYSLFYEMYDEHIDLLLPYTPTNNRMEAFGLYVSFIQRAVNSKMGREGYASGWEQGFADLFPLCELTPATRPLLLPINTGGLRSIEVFNESIVPDFNVRFRAFYNDLVPRLYGSEQWI